MHDALLKHLLPSRARGQIFPLQYLNAQLIQ